VLQDKGESCGQELVIREVKNDHNHAVIPAAIARHPKKRKLDESHTEVAAEFLQLHANKKLVQQTMQKKTGQFVTLKDLSNLQQKNKKKNPVTFGELVDHLRSLKNDLVIQAAHDGTEVQGIFVADQEMLKLYKSYPEVLLMDATHKLTKDRMATYILMAIDGNGESEIVAFFLTQNETHSLVLQMVKTFVDQFDAAIVTRTRVILTDKDFVERVVLKECFPNASLHLCLFHTSILSGHSQGR
jgi:zinc finger SWIM domain-containing protein 3